MAAILGAELAGVGGKWSEAGMLVFRARQEGIRDLQVRARMDPAAFLDELVRSQFAHRFDTRTYKANSGVGGEKELRAVAQNYADRTNNPVVVQLGPEGGLNYFLPSGMAGHLEDCAFIA
jgi:hypothetical protein